MMKAIDMHGHFGDQDRGAGSLRDRLWSGSIEVVRSRAQEVRIGLTVVSATTALVPYGGDPIAGNNEARQVAEMYPEILFWAVLNPGFSGSFEQVEKLLSHPRCTGIKIHPLEHNYQIRAEGDAIFEFAASHNALVLAHSGDRGCFPEDLVVFANKFPQVRLILAHLGHSSDESVSRQVSGLKRSRTGNIYMDTSSISSMYGGLIEWAVREVGYQRILFGTDTPAYFSPSQKARIEHAELPRKAKEAILEGNARTLLGGLTQ